MITTQDNPKQTPTLVHTPTHFCERKNELTEQCGHAKLSYMYGRSFPSGRSSSYSSVLL